MDIYKVFEAISAKGVKWVETYIDLEDAAGIGAWYKPKPDCDNIDNNAFGVCAYLDTVETKYIDDTTVQIVLVTEETKEVKSLAEKSQITKLGEYTDH